MLKQLAACSGSNEGHMFVIASITVPCVWMGKRPDISETNHSFQGEMWD